MTEDTAKLLAAAMNRLAAALEGLRGGALSPGIQVYHHGFPQQRQQISPSLWPSTIGGNGQPHV